MRKTEETFSLAEEQIGYHFRDRELLKTCFTHKSYSNAYGGKDNERLEFLGDAVLELCVSEMLFHACRGDEGRLTELRQQYVSKAALEQAAERAGIKQFLLYVGSDSNVGGKTASNLFEAVIGGIYLDGGMQEVRRFLTRYLSLAATENYKTYLQEYVQAREKRIPVYETTEKDGKYVCRVSALGKSAAGEGESKKTAETIAAKNLWQMFMEDNGN